MSLTTTRLYRSDDPGAPVLNGTAGSFIDVLRACLVGVSGVAYGTGANEKAPAGWTEEFTGTNKAVYRNSLSAGGTGCYLRVDDTGSLGGGALNTFCKVYGSMSGVDTGSDVAPDATASPDGDFITKSATTDSTARPWIVVADERTAYINVLPARTAFAATGHVDDNIGWFGDFDSHVPGDGYAYGIGARPGPAYAQNLNAGSALLNPGSNGCMAGGGAYKINSWLGRSIDMSAGAVRASIRNPANRTISQDIGVIGSNRGIVNPSPGGANEYYVPAELVHDGTIHGTLRGVMVPLNDMTAVTAGTTRSNVPGLSPSSAIMILRGTSPTSTNSPVYGGIGIITGAAW